MMKKEAGGTFARPKGAAKPWLLLISTLGLISALMLSWTACAPAKEPASVDPIPPSSLATGPGGQLSSFTQTRDRAQFDGFVAELDQKRRERLTWTSEERAAFSAFMPDYSGQLNTYTEEELALLTTRRTPSDLSAQEAREDVEAFFTLLRTVYGGYDYFGGDETFFPLRDLALSRLPDDGEVSFQELEKRLREAVQGSILDGHFMIGPQGVIEDSCQSMYYVPDLYFHDIKGMDPAWIRPTIGPDGELSYCFAALSHDGGDLPKTSAGPDGRSIQLDWIRAQAFEGWDEDQHIAYERRSYDGLPVLICETLVEPESVLEFMGRSGKEYRSLPVFAVDLRGNWGGNDGYAHQWVNSFAGSMAQAKMAGGVKFSQVCMAVRSEYESQRQQDLGVPPGQWGKVLTDGLPLQSDSLIFLLTDSETASAGEDFVSYLRSLNQVVTVGSNTAGCQTFGNVMDLHLPHSGLRVRMGTSFFFWDSVQNREGAGYLPDLWVNPPDALDAVARLCRYYNIK